MPGLSLSLSLICMRSTAAAIDPGSEQECDVSLETERESRLGKDEALNHQGPTSLAFLSLWGHSLTRLSEYI